jgi:hypothetical protein
MPRRLATSLALLIAISAGIALALPAGAAANGCPLRTSQGTAGTTADPIRIDTVADLNMLASSATCYAGSYVFQQTADLTLTAVFTPIASNATPFNGTYDGGGRTISGLTIDNTSAGSYKGMFAVISGGTVKRLTLRGASIVGTLWYYGVVAGEARNGSLIEQVTVIDSSVVSAGHGSEYMGGVVGEVDGSTVRDVQVSGLSVAIAVMNDYIGGIAGAAVNGAVIDRASADVSISGAGSYVGGIAGIAQQSGTVITDAYARGSVTGAYGIGGLLGAFYGGGGPITRSYATTQVTASGSGVAGGLVGRVLSTPVPPSAVASFWDVTTSGQATSANGAVGKTTAELTALATFVDAGWTIGSTWSAARTWTICARANGGYPFLSGAYTTATEPCTAPATPAAASTTGVPTPAGTLTTRNARLTGNIIRTQVTVSGAAWCVRPAACSRSSHGGSSKPRSRPRNARCARAAAPP